MKLPFDENMLRLFSSEMYDKYYDEEKGWLKPYGTCTFMNSAQFMDLKQRGFSVKIIGASEERFKGTRLQELGLYTGHDWALVNNRWIIDTWANDYLGIDRLIYDLHDAQHAHDYKELYNVETVVLYPHPTTCFKSWFRDAHEDWFEFTTRISL